MLRSPGSNSQNMTNFHHFSLSKGPLYLQASDFVGGILELFRSQVPEIDSPVPHPKTPNTFFHVHRKIVPLPGRKKRNVEANNGVESWWCPRMIIGLDEDLPSILMRLDSNMKTMSRVLCKWKTAGFAQACQKSPFEHHWKRSVIFETPNMAIEETLFQTLSETPSARAASTLQTSATVWNSPPSPQLIRKHCNSQNGNGFFNRTMVACCR